MTATPHATSVRTRWLSLRGWLARQPRRNVLLVALLPVLVWLWLPLLGGSRQDAAPAPGAAVSQPAAASGQPPPMPAGEVAVPTTIADGILAVAAFEARLRELTQPYRPRLGAETNAPVEAAPGVEPAGTPFTGLVPSAILLSRGGEAMAIVQGNAYRIGDTVAGRTIVAIEERRVVYREGTRTFTAEMGGATLGGHR